MSAEAIVKRIISDAEQAAAETVAEAKRQAEEIIFEAQKTAERDCLGAEKQVEEKCRAIESGKVAEARLDSSKILLREKRRVIDGIYESAAQKLNGLPKPEMLKLCQRLLEEYAEEGDEIAFSSDFPYCKEVASLDEAKAKKLKVSLNADKVKGGFVLRGKNADKDVSFAALLDRDREQRQAEIAAAIFSK